MNNEELYEKFKKDLKNYIFRILMVLVVLIVLYSIIPQTYDSTDGGFLDRSGMALHIDNKTGCHYLASQYGGIVARVDREGNHICTGEE